MSSGTERQQRELLAKYGVIVERERQGRGSRRVCYCRGPQGQRFIITTSLQRRPDWKAILAFETQLKRRLAQT